MTPDTGRFSRAYMLSHHLAQARTALGKAAKVCLRYDQIQVEWKVEKDQLVMTAKKRKGV